MCVNDHTLGVLADKVVKEQAKPRTAQRDAAAANTRSPKGTPVKPPDSKEISLVKPTGRRRINLPFRDLHREEEKIEGEETRKWLMEKKYGR